MINLIDESIINVTKTNAIEFSYVTTLNDNIFYTNCDGGSVTCIDFKGNVKWVFENEPFGYICR